MIVFRLQIYAFILYPARGVENYGVSSSCYISFLSKADLHSLFLQQLQFSSNLFALAHAVESADGAVGTYDAMTRNVRGKWIAAECLSDGLGTATADLRSQFAVGDGRAAWHVEESEIDLALKFGDAVAGSYGGADVWHGREGVRVNEGKKRCPKLWVFGEVSKK